MSLIETRTQDRVAIVTLNDPGRRNAISLPLAQEMVALFENLGGSSEVAAVIITGAPPAFCAGADLSQLADAPRERLRQIYRCFVTVRRSRLPVIAAVNGPAVGAGLNLALACDLRVASRSARFDSRFLELGLHPGGGHSWMLSQILGAQGTAALVLFGQILDGEEAARRGLAWCCVEDELLLEEAQRLAARVAAAPRELVWRIKTTLREVTTLDDHAAAVELELEPQLWSLEQPACVERLAALRQRISKK